MKHESTEDIMVHMADESTLALQRIAEALESLDSAYRQVNQLPRWDV